MRVLNILALLSLLACGADGEPTRPGEGESGVSVSGDARIGVRGSF